MSEPRLLRRLGLGDAVVIGLGSMIGAGVFAVFAPAAQAAGSALLAGLVLAAAVAYCNATSTAQLAAAHPTSGGAYAYGRAELGDWWGFLAGWCFVIGKTASCAAMALTFAAYAAPPEWERPVAIAAVAGLVAVNSFGVTRTAQLTRILVIVSLAALALVVTAGMTAPKAGTGMFADLGGLGGGQTGGAGQILSAGQIYGVLQSAGLLFFAFAGYARIATLGEEVRDPRRTIPRAIPIALGIAVAVYAVVAVAVLLALGPDGAAASPAPLAETVAAAGWDYAGWDWAGSAVRLGAAAASLGALLALIAGIGRTTLAMARTGDLPRVLAAVHPQWRVPRRAEFALGAIVIVVVALADLRGAIAFSSFGVLLYYFVANAAAWRQQRPARRRPRWVQGTGMAGCAALSLTLPLPGVTAGCLIVGAGVAFRALFRASGG